MILGCLPTLEWWSQLEAPTLLHQFLSASNERRGSRWQGSQIPTNPSKGGGMRDLDCGMGRNSRTVLGRGGAGAGAGSVGIHSVEW